MAIEFREDKLPKNLKDMYINELKKRDFKLDINSFGTLWVYDIKVINYMDLTDTDGFKITLENANNLLNYSIYLEDIKYFEIHNDK